MRLLALVLAGLCLSCASSTAPPARPAGSNARTPGERAVAEHFAARVEACRGGDAAACRHLAQRCHFASNDRELDRYADVFADACQKDVAAACGGQGWLLLQGGKTAEGLALLERACSAGDDVACALLGERLIGQDRRADGEAVLRRACSAHGGWPCTTVVRLEAQAELDPNALATGLAHACDTGDAFACFHLGQALAEGDPLPEDQPRATQLYQRACDADLHEACYNLAWQYRRGAGVDKDEARFLALAEHACQLGDAKACDDLAGGGNQPQRYCDLWGAHACFVAAGALGRTRGETADTAEAIVTNGLRGCRRGDPASCNVMHHVRLDFERACDSGEKVADSCTFVGFIYLFGMELPPISGKSIAPDARKAAAYFRRACEAGAKVACERAR
jgi:TPR repeat protein